MTAAYLRIVLNILFAFILLKNSVHCTYIRYDIQHYCEEHPDRRILIGNDGNYSTLILRSSSSETVSNEICQIKIIGENIAGIIVVVNNITLNNEINSCNNYLKLDEYDKWCNDENFEKSVTFNKSEIIIEFGTGSNSTSQFQLVITTFSGLWNKLCSNPNHIRCHGGNQECIYKGLECDGYANCPSGSDEEHCPDLQAMQFDDQIIAETNINETLKSETTETTSNETTLTPVINNYSTTGTTNESITAEVTVITPNDIGESTTYVSVSHPLTGGQITAIILVLIGLIAIVCATTAYMYKKHADNEVLYSPL